MGRKKILEKRMKRLMAKKQALAERAKASADVNEIRSLTEQVEDVNAEIEETQEELDAIEEEGESDGSDPVPGVADLPEGDQRSMSLPGPGTVNGGIVASFRQNYNASQQRENTDPYAGMEYRQAFKRYVQTGEQIPENLTKRDGMPANTTTLGAIIPTTILNEFIDESRKIYGQLYAKVRKINVQGGVKIPISELQGTFKWINESTVSPRQDGGKIKDFIEFSYNIGEIRVSQTLLSSIVAIDFFEKEIVRIMLKAYMRAMDDGIINGTGDGQMLGILQDRRVLENGNVIQMSASDMGNWTAWRKNFFAKLPLGWRNGEFIFPLSTVESYLETMADANNNPIFRQATALSVSDKNAAGSPNGSFFGRDITLVEPDIIPDYDAAESGAVIGVFWQPEEYVINTQMQFGMKRYLDEERNEYVNKMLTVVDGKILNVKGVWLIKKK